MNTNWRFYHCYINVFKIYFGWVFKRLKVKVWMFKNGFRIKFRFEFERSKKKNSFRFENNLYLTHPRFLDSSLPLRKCSKDNYLCTVFGILYFIIPDNVCFIVKYIVGNKEVASKSWIIFIRTIDHLQTIAIVNRTIYPKNW